MVACGSWPAEFCAVLITFGACAFAHRIGTRPTLHPPSGASPGYYVLEACVSWAAPVAPSIEWVLPWFLPLPFSRYAWAAPATRVESMGRTEWSRAVAGQPKLRRPYNLRRLRIRSHNCYSSNATPLLLPGHRRSPAYRGNNIHFSLLKLCTRSF